MQLTVLIVDDEPLFAKMCARLLLNAGIQSLVTSDPHEVLAVVQANQSISLLLSDMQMPFMSGRHLAATVRDRFADLPIVLMSADDSEEDRLGPGTEFDYPFIAKSRISRDLVAAIQAVVASMPAKDGSSEFADRHE